MLFANLIPRTNKCGSWSTDRAHWGPRLYNVQNSTQCPFSMFASIKYAILSAKYWEEQLQICEFSTRTVMFKAWNYPRWLFFESSLSAFERQVLMGASFCCCCCRLWYCKKKKPKNSSVWFWGIFLASCLKSCVSFLCHIIVYNKAVLLWLGQMDLTIAGTPSISSIIPPDFL